MDYVPPESHYECVVDMSQIETPIQVIAAEHLANYTGEELDSNWMLDDFFTTKIVMNLPLATERLKNFTEEMRQIGVSSFQRFNAVNGATEVPQSLWEKFYLNRCNIDLSTEVGQKIFTRIRKREAGCFLSCLGVYQRVKNAFDNAVRNLVEAEKSQDALRIAECKAEVDRNSRAIIFEDDAAFGFLQGSVATKEGAGRLFNEALTQLPDDWDIVYLVVQPTEPTIQISENLQQIFGSWLLPAYIIRYTVYDDLVKLFEQIYDPKVTQLATNDLTFAAFQRTRKTYAVRPAVAYQSEGESTITGEVFQSYQAPPEFVPVSRNNVTGIPKPGYPPVVRTVYELQEEKSN